MIDLDPMRVAAIAAILVRVKNVDTISVATGVAVDRIKEIASGIGIRVRTAPRPKLAVVPAIPASAIQDYPAMNMNEMAAKYGVPREMISQFLRSSGVRIHKQRIPEELLESARSLAIAGKPRVEVAKALGISVSMVGKIVGAGVFRKDQHRKYDYAAIIKRYQSGETAAAIASSIGATRQVVHQIIHHQGAARYSVKQKTKKGSE